MSGWDIEIPGGGSCVECKQPFSDGEPVVAVVYAGSAWRDGRAELVDGAEIYRIGKYHECHAPPEPAAAPPSEKVTPSGSGDSG